MTALWNRFLFEKHLTCLKYVTAARIYQPILNIKMLYAFLCVCHYGHVVLYYFVFFGEGMHSTEYHPVFICTTLTTLNVAKETNKLKQITTFYRPH